MLTLATLRLGLIVAAVLAGMVGLFVVFDAIGDLREAKVRAKIDAAIGITNAATGVANDADEETLAIAEQLRMAALAAAKKLPAVPQCKLTAEEAPALARIR